MAFDFLFVLCGCKEDPRSWLFGGPMLVTALNSA